MAHATVRWQLAVLTGAQLRFERQQSPFQLTLIRLAPLAPVQQGASLGLQQRDKVFRHHRCSGHRPRHRQIESSPQGWIVSGAFDAVRPHADPVTQVQGVHHGLNGRSLAADGIQQGHLGAWKGDRHGETWKSTPGAHVNGKPALMGSAQFLLQRPEAVEHLVDPVVIPLHQTRQVDPTVPTAQLILKGLQLLQLRGLRSPAEDLPERGSRQGVGHGVQRRLFLG